MKFLLFFMALTSFANAAGGAGGPTDLIPSFVNIAILGSLLIWKLKSPLKGFFATKSDSIEEMLERADSKAKEAEAMMEMQKKKTSGIEEEVKKIHLGAEGFLADFKAEYEKEVAERIQRLKEDATQKIETEKSDLTHELNAKLIDEVVVKTKKAIKADPSLSEGAANKLLEGIC